MKFNLKKNPMVSFFYFGENINSINHWSHHEKYKVDVIFKCFYNTCIFFSWRWLEGTITKSPWLLNHTALLGSISHLFTNNFRHQNGGYGTQVTIKACVSFILNCCTFIICFFSLILNNQYEICIIKFI